MGNNWRHKYFEKNTNELHANIFRSLEIEQYLKQILKKNGFNLHKCELNFSNFVVNIFLSAYKTEQKPYLLKENIQLGEVSQQKRKTTKLREEIKKHYLKKKFPNNLINELVQMKTLHSYKNSLSHLKTATTTSFRGLPEKITKSLNLFTLGQLGVNLTLQEINFTNSNPNAGQALLSFRKFERTSFFEDWGSLFIPLVTQRSTAKLLGTFVALNLEKMKRHNFFFNFLQESLKIIVGKKFSKVQGIKIRISGRLNNAARSRSKIIEIGEISLLKISSNMNYSESIAFTSNGTFGVKVWISRENLH